MLDPPDAFEAQCEEAALEDFQSANGYPVYSLILGFLLSMTVLIWYTQPPPEVAISKTRLVVRALAEFPRLIYPLPESKGKVWDPVVRPPPNWMRIGFYHSERHSHA